MAYRRKHSMRSTMYEVDDFRSVAAPEPELPAPTTVMLTPSSPSTMTSPSSSSSSSLAAQAIRASAAHRDSSLSSAYGESAYCPREASAYEYTSMKSLNESKYGFWGVLARKAKAILEDDNAAKQFNGQQFDTFRRNQSNIDASTDSQYHQPYRLPESYRNTENPAFQKGSEAIASSLKDIGGTIKNALEEGLKNVENKTADIIQETRKLQIRRKGSGSSALTQAVDLAQIQSDHDMQLKASRDVANAMAAKAKLLLRELKTVKADQAFAKERCGQLEEENKILREGRDKGDNPEDDDLIRLQLETLLAEKARLAHENSVYARENRFLREIVEYHQLTMQDVVYVNEGIEEVSEVYPFPLCTSTQQSLAGSPSPSASLSPSPSPSRASPPPPLNSMVVPEACPIIPTPPAAPSKLTNQIGSSDSRSTLSTPPEGLTRQNSAASST